MLLENIIKKHLIESAEVDASVFNNPDLMVSDLKLDSLGLVEMIFEVEERYGFQFDEPSRFANMRFNEMVSEIEQEIRNKHDGELPALDEKG